MRAVGGGQTEGKCGLTLEFGLVLGREAAEDDRLCLFILSSLTGEVIMYTVH